MTEYYLIYGKNHPEMFAEDYNRFFKEKMPDSDPNYSFFYAQDVPIFLDPEIMNLLQKL